MLALSKLADINWIWSSSNVGGDKYDMSREVTRRQVVTTWSQHPLSRWTYIPSTWISQKASVKRYILAHVTLVLKIKAFNATEPFRFTRNVNSFFSLSLLAASLICSHEAEIIVSLSLSCIIFFVSLRLLHVTQLAFYTLRFTSSVLVISTSIIDVVVKFNAEFTLPEVRVEFLYIGTIFRSFEISIRLIVCVMESYLFFIFPEMVGYSVLSCCTAHLLLLY